MKYTPAKQALIDKLAFDPGPHRYTMDGFVIPSVTKVMERYLPYGNLPSEVRDAALLRGTLVHRLTEELDTNSTDPELWTLADMAGLIGYVRAWEKFKSDNGITVLEVEQKVYHSRYRYCGTFDRIVEEKSAPGIPILVDIKTGSYSPYYALQTAAYAAAIEEGGMAMSQRWCVVLKETGTYTKVVNRERSDTAAFFGALKMFEWLSRFGSPS